MIILACIFTDIYLFKMCLKNINAGASFPGRWEDFDSDAAYQQWRTLETSHLQQLMVAMVQINPELAKSSPSSMLPSTQQSNVHPGSHYPSADSPARHSSISSWRSFIIPHDNLSDDAEGEDEELPVGHYFTFIPPNPRKFTNSFLSYVLLPIWKSCWALKWMTTMKFPLESFQGLILSCWISVYCGGG